MYSIIQKIYEKNNKILKEGLKKVLSGEDVSSLTVAIKEFTDVLGKELFSEIAKQLDEIIFEDNKKKKQYEPVRFQEKSLITKNGKAKFERRYYQDKETGEYVYLTGFDATTLNTLWVDKNLKQHGLIQAYSRTNRILNSVKSYGNIVCFRDLQEQTNDAIALFGDKDASGIVLLKSYDDYYYGYEDDKGKHQKGYEERIAELIQKYPLGEQIIGEQAKKDFIVAMGNILRLKNILSSFDKFEGNEILSERDFQDYIGTYTDLYEEFKRDKTEAESIKDDVVFEMELVKQIEVNIDYILMLVAKYHESNCTDKEILGSIDKAIKSSLALRSKKELIDTFISKINVNTDVMNDWTKFVKEQEETDLKKLIEEETRKFIDNSFRDGQVKTSGTDIEKILPPMRRFGGGNRTERKQTIIDKILKFFEKYFGIGIFGK